MGYEINEFYRSRIEQTIDLTLQDCPRVMVVRVDLRFPDYYPYHEYSKPYISRFFESLKERIRNDTRRKGTRWNKPITSTLDYAWVREVGHIKEKNHYHLMLLVDKDVYYRLGDFNEDEGTLVSIIRKAWCSALGVPYPDMKHLVDISRLSPIYLNRNSPPSPDQLWNLNESISYMAKEATKQYGPDQRSFGCSR